MPTWSDLYYLERPSCSFDLPPLMEGLMVEIRLEPKRPKHDFVGGIETYVQVLEVIGDYILAKNRKKINHFRNNELLTFHKSYIFGVSGDWEYSKKYQYVKVSKGVYYHKHEIDHVYYMLDEPPFSYGMFLSSSMDNLDNAFDEDEYIRLSIEEAINLDPDIEPCLRLKGRSYKKIGGIFLEVDSYERNDDQDEWQYH